MELSDNHIGRQTYISHSEVNVYCLYWSMELSDNHIGRQTYISHSEVNVYC